MGNYIHQITAVFVRGEDREVLQVNANPIEVDEASTQYKVMRIII